MERRQCINFFMLGFCVNGVAWRLDQGAFLDIVFPIILILLFSAVEIVNYRRREKVQDTILAQEEIRNWKARCNR